MRPGLVVFTVPGELRAIVRRVIKCDACGGTGKIVNRLPAAVRLFDAYAFGDVPPPARVTVTSTCDACNGVGFVTRRGAS